MRGSLFEIASVVPRPVAPQGTLDTLQYLNRQEITNITQRPNLQTSRHEVTFDQARISRNPTHMQYLVTRVSPYLFNLGVLGMLESTERDSRLFG